MRIAIIGYGKMGHMIESIALERGHSIACAIDRIADRPLTLTDRSADRPATPVRLFSPEEGFTSEEFRSADVAIEFTTPATAKDNILRAWAQGVPVISGSTGWKPEELKIEDLRLKIEGNKTIISNEAGKVMLVWSSNYSVGVNITFELNKILAQMMSTQPQYTPSIKEIHHIHKLDKPSGTAKTLAEQIQDTDLSKYRSIEDIQIESIREGEVPGTHIVTWDSEEDTIVLTHIAKGRRGFALGAVLAAESLARQQHEIG